MSYLFQNYMRADVEFIKANGNYLIDQTGRTYLDFSSGIGVTNLGFNKDVKKAVEQQLELIWHSPNIYKSFLQEKVAEKLISTEDYVAFFCNSGTEANEAAIKLARKATGKSEIIAFEDSFHGRTYGSMSATGQEAIKFNFEPVVPGFKFAEFNNFSSFKSLVTKDTAAVMLELIQGESGVRPANKTFIQQLVKFCNQHHILLIIDEIQTGIGRTGKLFAYEHYDISPDIITLAKGLGNGIPVGALLGKRNISDAFGYGSHGTTFGGNRLAMAAALKTLETIEYSNFLESVYHKGEYLLNCLNKIFKDYPSVTDIRGKGLMIGIETTCNINEIVSNARTKGLIILTAGTNVIRLLPPLTITFEQIEEAVVILKECFNELSSD
ncbi:acetylornithine transaminase [Staphylococcus capitis]|uniref:acetylornithine transaminase n=1 Tax=Staphylococcus capitis TaxID=29388 RepID=UPI001D138646|nr:acetylornithine transaminase [Staphylococcus capitis]MCC3754690.1 acetylornithine transaminase [Staphylococcus capitis]MDH8728706.1 acetylornithine transaminase [Staphylococcus capitis]MDH8921922.1 acetylornithine transaminase [Staphylococcus capitis]MDH8943197.1 acetylornithine transaminase [Staphylococcus capitis]MDH9591898.1 acetylornithine transaminase [Staphylococcus capitis]